MERDKERLPDGLEHGLFMDPLVLGQPRPDLTSPPHSAPAFGIPPLSGWPADTPSAVGDSSSTYGDPWLDQAYGSKNTMLIKTFFLLYLLLTLPISDTLFVIPGAMGSNGSLPNVPMSKYADFLSSLSQPDSVSEAGSDKAVFPPYNDLLFERLASASDFQGAAAEGQQVHFK